MNDAERIGQRPVGAVAARMFGAREVLRRRASQARLAARDMPKDSPAAAALRGKATGLQEGIDMMKRLELGRPLRGRRRRLHDRNPNLDLTVGCEQECPECGSTDLHHCIWDGLSCLVCGWQENPL